jgi:hypothetical protein
LFFFHTAITTSIACNRPKRSCTKNVKYVEDDVYEDEDDFCPTDDSDDSESGDGDFTPDYQPGDESDSESLEECEPETLQEEEEEEEEEDTCDFDSDSTDYRSADEDGFVEEETPNMIVSDVPRAEAPATDEAGEGDN